ncbi:unnamed protein product [Rotaria sp. Silwood2]|nr:unnamed protein product [Rotaria sp. Silwood2]
MILQYYKKKKKKKQENFSILAYNELDSIDHFSIERHPQEETTSRTSQSIIQSSGIPVLVPKSNSKISGGVQTTMSLHSFSSIDSSAEMARYFPDAQTPRLSPFRHHQEDVDQPTQTTTTTTTQALTDINTINSGPYATASAHNIVQQPFAQPIRAGIIAEQPVRAANEHQFFSGIQAYSSQIEGLSIPQAIVNDVIVDLQTKVINESQQQYYRDLSTGNYFEQISPIYIRAPNPTIILRSDLPRLRHTFKADRSVLTDPLQHTNQFKQNTFQQPRFPPPPPSQQHYSTGILQSFKYELFIFLNYRFFIYFSFFKKNMKNIEIQHTPIYRQILINYHY